jgi:hypothetical protein
MIVMLPWPLTVIFRAVHCHWVNFSFLVPRYPSQPGLVHKHTVKTLSASAGNRRNGCVASLQVRCFVRDDDLEMIQRRVLRRMVQHTCVAI